MKIRPCLCSSVRAQAMLLVLHVLVQLWHSVDLVAIDNDVQGDPTVECGDSSLTFSVKTKKLFAGRIFVKGKTAEPPCIRSDFAKQTTSTPVFELNFGSCGMRGQRADEPRGMFYSVTLVVSFHPLFVTKVDRSYRVKCFFEEALRTLTAGLDVSMISTADVTAFRASTGTCTYTIHQGTTAGGPSNIGPPISVAQVGDKIVHRWECTDAMYGILVRSCYVTDGFGTQAEVIDRRGCPVDPILISGISYDSTLTQAYAESHVFKFADRPGVWFYCQLQLCLKMSQACEGITPPNCGMMPPNITGPALGPGETMPPWYNRTSPPNGTEGTRPPETGATPNPSNITAPSGSNPPPTGIPVNGSVATAIIPISPPAAGGEIPSGASSNTGLPPAPPWAVSNGTAAPGGTTNAPSDGASRVTIPPGYIPPSAKRKILLRQRVDDEQVEVSTVPPIYEEEELIYDESGPGTDSTTASTRHATPSTVTTASGSGSGEAIVVTGIRRWRRPSPTAGSLERAITYRAHRRGTTPSGRGLVKRAPTPSQEHEQDPEDESRTTRRYQEIEKTMRHPVSEQDKKRQQKQQRVLQQQQQKKKDPRNKEEPSQMETDNVFTYKDSELSNRLIIFDVDEEPPPDYMHWSRNSKEGSGTDQDEDMVPTPRSVPDRKDSNHAGSGLSKKTTAVPDGCVVSAQGLIMILTASGGLSALLIFLLAAVCFRYRQASATKTFRNRPPPRPSSESEDSGITSRHSDELEGRRAKDKATRWHHQPKPQRVSNSSNSTDTLELPRLPRPHERRKHR